MGFLGKSGPGKIHEVILVNYMLLILFTVLGNCSPRFMRCTMYNIPCNKDLLQASSIPLATVITPFAETGPSEVREMIAMEAIVIKVFY